MFSILAKFSFFTELLFISFAFTLISKFGLVFISKPRIDTGTPILSDRNFSYLEIFLFEVNTFGNPNRKNP